MNSITIEYKYLGIFSWPVVLKSNWPMLLTFTWSVEYSEFTFFNIHLYPLPHESSLRVRQRALLMEK